MAEFEDLPNTIREFFTDKEFAEISEYEKLRFSNLRVNYEFLSRRGKKAVLLIWFGPSYMKLILN